MKQAICRCHLRLCDDNYLSVFFRHFEDGTVHQLIEQRISRLIDNENIIPKELEEYSAMNTEYVFSGVHS